jgi:ribosomal-protein-serine acetyltransferase
MSPIDPLLLDFPDHIETERLLIRAPRPGDGPMINEGVRESFNELRVWMPWSQTLQTVEESEAVARRMAAKFLLREEMMLLLLDRVSGELVGSSGLHNIDWDVPRFEIGYWVRTSRSGQGYITEAVNGITSFCFDTLNAQRVEIRCDSRNLRSAAVAERAGFKLDGSLRQAERAARGDLRDTLVYSKIRDEYHR